MVEVACTAMLFMSRYYATSFRVVDSALSAVIDVFRDKGERRATLTDLLFPLGILTGHTLSGVQLIHVHRCYCCC